LLQLQFPLGTLDDRASYIPLFTPHHAAREVAQTALQAFLVALNDVLVAVIGVLRDTSIVCKVVAHCVDAEAVHGEEGIHHIARRLGHFLPAEGPMRVGENLCRWWDGERHEEGRPVDAVEAENCVLELAKCGWEENNKIGLTG